MNDNQLNTMAWIRGLLTISDGIAKVVSNANNKQIMP